MSSVGLGWEKEQESRIHKKKLQSIKNGPNLGIDNASPSSFKLGKLIVMRKDFKKVENSLAVYQTNKILISKLDQISKRKPNFGTFQQAAHKTLNYNLRMDSLKKIEAENFKVFHRIVTKEAHLSQKQQLSEFNFHKKLKKLISRKQNLRTFKVRP